MQLTLLSPQWVRTFAKSLPNESLIDIWLIFSHHYWHSLDCWQRSGCWLIWNVKLSWWRLWNVWWVMYLFLGLIDARHVNLTICHCFGLCSSLKTPMSQLAPFGYTARTHAHTHTAHPPTRHLNPLEYGIHFHKRRLGFFTFPHRCLPTLQPTLVTAHSLRLFSVSRTGPMQ